MMHSVSSVSFNAISVPTVGIATPIRISAGRIVRPISRAGLPWVCSGMAWPRSRNLTMMIATKVSTITPTTPAMANTGHWRLWIV